MAKKLEIKKVLVTGNITSGSNTITNLSSTVGLSNGDLVLGAGIPSGSRITNVNSGSSQITISNNATATTTSVKLSIMTDDIIVSKVVNGVYTVGDQTIGGSKTFSSPIITTKVTGLTSPSSGSDAASKEYVDDLAQGLKAAPAAEVATTANLVANYSNGANNDGIGATLTSTTNGAFPTIDGYTLSSTTPGLNGVLVKNQTNSAHNGRYNLTQVGDASNPWILTRCQVCDQSSEIPGSYVFIKHGTLYSATGWIATVTNAATFAVGTDPINYFQFSGAGTYTATDGVSLNGTQFSADSTVVRTSGDQTIGGVKTFTSTISGSISGNSGSATLVATTQKSDDVSYQVPFVQSVTAGNQALHTDSASSLTFNPSTNTLLSTNLNVSEKLGIGITTPNNSLHIRGPVGNLIGTSGSLLISTIDTGTSVLNARGAGITFTQLWEAASPNSSIRTGAIYGLKTTGNGVFGGGLAFYSQPQADVNMVESMRINNLGLVGIGETTLAAQLQVKSGATDRTPIIVNTLASHTARLQDWQTNGSLRATVANNGRFANEVGISNLSSINNSFVETLTTGTVISRNIADANTALKTQISHADSTANIQEWWSNISGTTALRASLTKNGSLIANNLTLSGDLTVNGSVTTLDTQTVNIKDNVILINSNQTGTPSSLLEGGIEVERGDLTNYKFVFAEATTDFRIGQTGDLQAVATRQDAPTSNGIAFWNNTAKRFDTSSGLTVNSSGNLIDARITNSAVGVSPLIVNGVADTTANLQVWQLNGSSLSWIESDGSLRIGNIRNKTTANNSSIGLGDTGTVISRNINDATNVNPTLIVNQQQGASDILRLQFAGANKLEVTKDGFLNQNGIRLLHTNGTSNIYVGNSGNTTTTSGLNAIVGSGAFVSSTSGNGHTAVGYFALRNNTSGFNNTAVGREAGHTITTGGNSTFVGHNAGNNTLQLATGNNMTAIGYEAYTDASNQMVFGNSAVTQFKFDRNTAATILAPQIISSSANINLFERTTTLTNTIRSSLAYLSTTSGDMVDGFGNGILFQIKDNANVVNEIGVIGAIRSGADNSGRLTFITRNAGVEAEKMTIMPDGKVGIGTITPSQALHVIGGQRIEHTADAALQFVRSGSNSFSIEHDTTKLYFYNMTTTAIPLMILNNSNVGINEVSPSAQLQVKSGATNRIPLIVDTLASHAEDLQVWRVNGSQVARIEGDGGVRTGIIRQINGVSNGFISLANTGITISRNIADTNPALIVNLANTGATSDITRFQKAGTTLASVENDGSVNTSSRFKYGASAYTQYNSTDKSIDFVFAD
jgi:hypothetical protein